MPARYDSSTRVALVPERRAPARAVRRPVSLAGVAEALG